MYAILGVVGGVLIWAFLPETRGVRLEDMESVFRTTAARPAPARAQGLDLGFGGEGGLGVGFGGGLGGGLHQAPAAPR